MLDLIVGIDLIEMFLCIKQGIPSLILSIYYNASITVEFVVFDLIEYRQYHSFFSEHTQPVALCLLPSLGEDSDLLL